MVNTRCSQPKCYNCISKSNKMESSGNKISFHKFPKNLEIRKLWLKFCHISEKNYIKRIVLCSEHFVPDSFVKNFKYELMDVDSNRRLKSGGNFFFLCSCFAQFLHLSKYSLFQLLQRSYFLSQNTFHLSDKRGMQREVER